MNYISQETSYVTGLEGKSGDPSPITAYGVFLGIKASVERVFGSNDLKEKTVAIQGLGHVGIELARLLSEAGANLIVADIYPDRVKEVQRKFPGVQVVEPEKIYEVGCDIFSPCALGAVINENTVEKLRCKIVAGSANNQLEDDSLAEKLSERGILYAPDYIINGGGVINIAEELTGLPYNKEKVLNKLSVIPLRLKEVFHLALSEGITTARAADIITSRRFKG
jgi:leucine dehydrogenase